MASLIITANSQCDSLIGIIVTVGGRVSSIKLLYINAIFTRLNKCVKNLTAHTIKAFPHTI